MQKELNIKCATYTFKHIIISYMCNYSIIYIRIDSIIVLFFDFHLNFSKMVVIFMF